jgi:aspartyl-tRNA(Asn)/glutamyl-tRNA(Gln) amidotransferase subunit A
VDVVVSPTMPMPAPELGADGKLDRTVTSVATTTMRYWNGVGYPALVLPMGFSAAGLPLSLQVTSCPVDEPLLLSAGAAFQALTACAGRPRHRGGCGPGSDGRRVRNQPRSHGHAARS